MQAIAIQVQRDGLLAATTATCAGASMVGIHSGVCTGAAAVSGGDGEGIGPAVPITALAVILPCTRLSKPVRPSLGVIDRGWCVRRRVKIGPGMPMLRRTAHAEADLV